MKKTLLVMSQQMQVTLQSKTFIIFALAVPIVLGLIALVMGMVNRNATADLAAEMAATAAQSQQAEGYVDQAGLVQTLPADLPSGRLLAFADEPAAQTALRAGQIGSYYVIPADYVQSGEISNVRLTYGVIGDQTASDAIEEALSYNLLGRDAALAERVRTPLEIFITDLSAEEKHEETWFTEMFPTLMTLILYMVILLPAQMLVSAVANEKKNRVMEVLMASVSPRQMITGKILALGVLGLLETAIWVAVLYGVANFGGQALSIPEGYSIPARFIVWALVYFIFGYAIYGALLAGVGALVPDLKGAQGLSFIVMAPLIAGYTLNIMVIASPNGLPSMFLSLFPLTSPVSMMSRMAATAVPIWQALLAAGLQLLTALGIVRLAAKLFRTQHLLSGQPVTAGGFLRALVGRA
jgi:ABC-2 type transport system permease protein